MHASPFCPALRDRSFQGLLTKWLLVMPVRMVLPVVVVYTVAKWKLKVESGSIRGTADALRLIGRHALRAYVTFEIYFYFAYLWKYWKLNRVNELSNRLEVVPQPAVLLMILGKVHLVPRDLDITREKRMAKLKRSLRGLRQIHIHAAVNSDHVDACDDEATREMLHSVDCIEDRGVHGLNRSAQNLLNEGARRCGSRFTSSENLVRLWESDQTKKRKYGGLLRLPTTSDGTLASSLWSEEFRLSDESSEARAVRVRALQRAEISSWFNGAPVEALKRGNVRVWIAEYFFEGYEVDQLTPSEEEAMEDMVDYMEQWARAKWEGRNAGDAGGGRYDGINEDVKVFRLTKDPLPSLHRPAICYAMTHMMIPALTSLAMTGPGLGMGFSKYRAGSLEYYFRPGMGRSGDMHLLPRFDEYTDQRKMPIVFCHGIGLGLLPYIPVVHDIVRRFPDRDIFCVDMPHIACRPFVNLPSAREMSACVIDMLRAWRYSHCHVIGHSFGCILSRWILAYQPSIVRSLSLVDPVNFLLVKSDLLHNALKIDHSDPFGALATYFSLRELYTVHTFCRNFFWEENIIWPEDLRDVPTHITLCGNDFIAPAHSTRNLLGVEKLERAEIAEINGDSAAERFAPLSVYWIPDGVHAEILFYGSSRREVLSRVEQLVSEFRFTSDRVALSLVVTLGENAAMDYAGDGFDLGGSASEREVDLVNTRNDRNVPPLYFCVSAGGPGPGRQYNVDNGTDGGMIWGNSSEGGGQPKVIEIEVGSESDESDSSATDSTESTSEPTTTTKVKQRKRATSAKSTTATAVSDTTSPVKKKKRTASAKPKKRLSTWPPRPPIKCPPRLPLFHLLILIQKLMILSLFGLATALGLLATPMGVAWLEEKQKSNYIPGLGDFSSFMAPNPSSEEHASATADNESGPPRPQEQPLRPQADDEPESEETEEYYVDPGKHKYMKVFACSDSEQLASEICANLGTTKGRAYTGKFADGEVIVNILDEVRGQDCFIIQQFPISRKSGVSRSKCLHDAIMESYLMISALRRASARTITLITPYFAYARHMESEGVAGDPAMTQPATPLAASDIALMYEAMGVDRVVTVDLHEGSLEG
ncbi:Ribose-phosphate pyrophosphokinase 2, partial [Perkinsus olseni]